MGCANSDANDVKDVKNKVLVIVGPSGVGKDTLMAQLFKKYPNKFIKAVTHTSRAMRPNEAEGVNYYYITKEDFENKKNENFFVETNFYNNNYYGTSKQELLKGNTLDKIMYLIIDINGAKAINNLKISANFIAIIPKEFEVLKKRLEGRGTETEDVIKGRIETAKNELNEIENLPFFNYKIVNDNLEEALNDISNKMKILYPDLIK